MAPSITTPNQYFPQIDPKIDSQIRTHLQLVYSAINDHDAAITLVNTKLSTLSTSASTAAATASTTTEIIESVAGVGTVNDQQGVTAYLTVQSDSGTLLILGDASPVAVSLDSTVTVPYLIFATNFGVGLVTFTPTSGTINIVSTFTLPQNNTSIIVSDGTDWWASAYPSSPVNFPAVTHEFLTAFNASTGVFSAAQPAFTDISGNLATSQLPTAGLSVTITTAALTVGGTQGSQTFTGGILTAQVPAT